MKKNIYRSEDEQIYLKEERYNEPLEIFKDLMIHARRKEGLRSGITICDFGCAAGEFLFYLTSEFPNADYYGYDIVPSLLKKAQVKVPDAVFKIGSVLERDLLNADSIDLAFLLGVHSIFDEFETCFSNLIHWTRPSGRIYITGMFNNFPLDVWVKYRRCDDPDRNHREPGWNIFSKESISRYLDDVLGPGRHTYIPFEMPFDLDPNPIDPARTWTFLDSQGRRLFTNGMSLICNLEHLEIRL